MASRPKRACRQVLTTDEIFQYVLEARSGSDDDIDTGGIPADEESDLDRELGLVSDDSSDEDFVPDKLPPPGDSGPDDQTGVAASPVTPPTVDPQPGPSHADDTATSGPLSSASFYDAAAARPRVRRRPVPAPVAPAIAQGGGSKGRTRAGGSRGGVGRRRGRGRGRGCVGGQGDAVPEVFQSYDDKDDGNALPAFTPDRPPGVHFDVPLLRSTMVKAVDFFNLYFTVDMIDFIVNHTNSYAWEHITDNSHRSYALPDGSWQETNRDEIRRLIALLIYFGIVKVGSSVDKYWSTKSLYHGLWARSIMSRYRYFALMAMLHVVDPASEDATDKLREVDSFVKYFKTRCLSLYQPRQNVAIDERMVKSRHRSGIRQYIKDKPTKWGIKLWVLADSSNGYTIDFNVYIGKAAGRQVSANGLGYDVVMKLMAPLFSQGYHLYVDNFYTSLTLFKDLFARGVAATGTALETRRDFPVNLRNGKEWAKNKVRGSMRWERDHPCLALQWLDNKVVSVITTIDNANVKTEVNRKIRIDGKWSLKKVPQPGAISNYNKFMNAVDRSDQILGTNSVLRKCMKWWKTLFFHLIDMSVVNSFILFKEHQTKFPDREGLKRPANYNITNFREDIVRQL